ncbi:galactose mutarotase [Coraliomargarita sp. SDUM461003]|uniref:Aldose 1-epimerase n=2 Tax=Thalassobacterium TaxID=3410851 RepID=A0ABU1AXY3_9BACT|nr:MULTISPECIES: aldose epimerase family protein [unclassified Coraliomargarita]MDQ8193600.1 galactose mutarotase [Coraliomargarita sp. SDUM461004]MDQ8209024.1 galactose mutarotase [Coraliomargarita sp. SDUM461003]
MSITSTPYGTLPSGEAVDLFTLTNANGLSAEVTNYGAILVSLNVPDREGALTDVVLGKDSLEDYLAGHPCFGSICGRVAGRIGGASFELDGKTYPLEANYEGISNLHSGPEGFHTMLWKAEIIEDFGVQKLQLQLTDPDGHNGFPGEVHCTVTYALLDNDALEIHYEASSDHTTPFNPTNHSYFNLRGEGDILGHKLQILADSVATVDENCSLIGRRDPVVAGYNDYREPVQLGSLKTLEVGNADIHFFLNEGRTAQAKLAARVIEPDSGRIMEVLTTAPGVQFYAGLSLSEEGPEIGKGGAHHKPMHALCLETQDYADSIHFPEMGNAILKPGETFKSTTLFRFSAQ